MTIDTFQLVKERCLFVNLNVRTEAHGDEREPACDLQFEFSGANNLLLKLHPDLRDALYRADDNKDIEADHKPHLKFPLIGTIPWDLEIPRTLLRVHDIDDPANDVVLGGGRTNKFKVTPIQGGTVKWSFRCQFSEPDADAIAALMRVLNQKIPISLECADEEDEADNFDQAEQLGKEPMSAARQEAESLFNSDFSTMGDDDVVDAEFTPPAESESNVKPISSAKAPKAARARRSAGAAPE